MQIDVYYNADGSITVGCGCWLLLRRFPNGKVRVISYDAPRDMMLAAEQKLEELK